MKPILIVDDNRDDVEVVRRLVGKFWADTPVFAVESAEQAIAYLKGEGVFSDRELCPLPVLILLDFVMPGKGGLAVLDWLQQQPTLNIPVIILTGIADLRRMSIAYQKGAQSFLMKPTEEGEFVELVNKVKCLVDSSSPRAESNLNQN